MNRSFAMTLVIAVTLASVPRPGQAQTVVTNVVLPGAAGAGSAAAGAAAPRPLAVPETFQRRWAPLSCLGPAPRRAY